jgi:predicted helicase
MYFYSEDGVRLDNITEWGLQQFHNHYNNLNIIKEDIFNYVYAVLHNPQYRIKYELNLKRDFPRIPFYTDFHKWAAYGKELMDLHINYETAKPFKLKEISFVDSEDLKPKLKANREASTIILDEATTLTGIPSEAWQYKIGNRSALEWILDQYKEKKPKDPTIREKFNNYKFSVYKDKVIDLIKRVCTVSIETVRIIKEMEQSTN